MTCHYRCFGTGKTCSYAAGSTSRGRCSGAQHLQLHFSVFLLAIFNWFHLSASVWKKRSRTNDLQKAARISEFSRGQQHWPHSSPVENLCSLIIKEGFLLLTETSDFHPAGADSSVVMEPRVCWQGLTYSCYSIIL